MQPEYIKRKTKKSKLIENDNKSKITLENFLKEEYPYIIQSMKYENYKIEYNKYDLIHELLYKDDVIGIMSIELIDSDTKELCINEVYILPEYRHRGIFFDILTTLLCQPNITISLRNPNRKIIDLLINYGFAKKLKNNLIISYIDFYVDDSNIYKNKQIQNEYTDYRIKNELIPTDFYDLNIDSSVFIEFTDMDNLDNNKAYIVKARLTDSKEDEYYTKLKNVDNIYLENLKNRLLIPNDELIEFLQKVQDKLDNNFNINKILGTETKLTQFFLDQLKEYDLSIEDGFKIRDNVLKALSKDEIIPKSTLLRTLYLLENYPLDDIKLLDSYRQKTSFNECPYCSTINQSSHEVCSICGYNLNKEYENQDKLQEIFADNILLKKVSERLLLKKDLNYKQDKINKILKEELSYLEYDEEEVYKTHCIISTYQFLKNINEIIYFEIYNYDLMNNIREGSAFEFAKYNILFEELKNYKYYLMLLEEYYPEKELRKILKRNNYDDIGEKQELIEKIETNINPKDIFGDKYALTEDGKDFIDNKDFIENYLENLSEFTFYEYMIYYQKNNDKSYSEINDGFVKYMKKISLQTGNYYKYHDCVRHQINTSKNLKHDDYLVLFTQLFIIDINFWISSRKHRKNNKPLSMVVMDEYPEIKRLYYEMDIDEIFDEALNSVELGYLKMNDEFVKFYLIKSLEYEDIDDINREIEYNIFKDEYLMRYSF